MKKMPKKHFVIVTVLANVFIAGLINTSAFAEDKKDTYEEIRLKALSRSGEVGNDRIKISAPGSSATKGAGKPAITKTCAEKVSWSEFHNNYPEPEYAEFMNMLGDIYPGFRAKLLDVDDIVRVCIIDDSIEDTFQELPYSADPRVALWAPMADGDKSLLVIDRKYFYTNPDMTPAIRSSTIFRELLHPLFFEAYGGKVLTSAMKRDLRALILDTYLEFQTIRESSDAENVKLAGEERIRKTRYPEIWKMLHRHNLLKEFGTLADACYSSVLDCKNAYRAMDTLSSLELIEPPNPVRSFFISGGEPIRSLSAASFLISKIRDIEGMPFKTYNINGIGRWARERALMAKTGSEVAALSSMLSQHGLLVPTIADGIIRGVVISARLVAERGDGETATAMLREYKSLRVEKPLVWIAVSTNGSDRVGEIFRQASMYIDNDFKAEEIFADPISTRNLVHSMLTKGTIGEFERFINGMYKRSLLTAKVATEITTHSLDQENSMTLELAQAKQELFKNRQFNYLHRTKTGASAPLSGQTSPKKVINRQL